MISAFILSYNQPQMLINSVRSLCQTGCISEILIFENHSSEDMTETYQTCRNLSSLACEIIIETLATPLSFSQGQNWGIEKAKNPYVLLMNNDAVLDNPSRLETSLRLMEADANIGIVGHKIFNLDGSLNHAGLFVMTHTGGVAHIGSNTWGGDFAHAQQKDRDGVTAACALVRKTEIRFDETYWFDLEDIDFCWQYRQAGHRIVYNPEVSVTHPESTTRASVQNSNSEWQKKQDYGRRYFKKKWAQTLRRYRVKHLGTMYHSSPDTREKLSAYFGQWLALPLLIGLAIYWGVFLQLLGLILIFVTIRNVAVPGVLKVFLGKR